MTAVLLLSSIEPAGKTALAAALMKNLMGKGKKVGYFVPLEIKEQKAHKYQDAKMVGDMLGLEQGCQTAPPLQISTMDLWNSLSEDSADLLGKIRDGFNSMAGDKDIVLIEGLSGLTLNGASTLSCYKLSELFSAPVIILQRYAEGLNPNKLVKVRQELGSRLSGVIVNFVPQHEITRLSQELEVAFSRIGIKLLGTIAEDRDLLGISVAELARALGGHIITAEESADRQVNNVMLGAMSLDSGTGYFSRKDNKAAVINSERSDMQLAALETSTSCLVLTGETPPLQAVIYMAESKKIPIVIVPKKIDEVVRGLEEAFSRSVFNSKHKFYRFQTLSGVLDFSALYRATGLAL
ncbi:MAG TPA: DRTGG domain-containing protein [Dehalococcoidia bacterium]|nr:DRTGG domain-containing protein [Dehalococcoidia bacterium]